MHDTPTSRLRVAPAGFGVRWIDQLLPFHRSASVASPPPRFVNDPTAVQDLGDAHDTPSRLLLVAPAGFGVRWIDQLLPFHRSASVTSPPARLVENPTAVQELGDGHDTPSSLLDMPPAGFGVRCTPQPEAEAPVAIASHSASVTNPSTAPTTLRAPVATRPAPRPSPSNLAATITRRRRSPGYDTAATASSRPDTPPSSSSSIARIDRL